ncbi:MAG: MgtC/SapB family protein [Alphaproteobacteria bacterium]|nr:MgtC/SapB family protein [Alphaproteobacteria bacterium]
MDELDLFKRLGLALAIGLMIGVERGWRQREAPEGARVVGVRSFALIGLLGGLWALLARHAGESLLGVAFLGFVALVAVGHVMQVRRWPDIGLTTEIAELLAFSLGALAVLGEMAVASAGGVVALALLGMKRPLHAWIERIEELELAAAIKLLLISVLLLPLLPDRGLIGGDLLNPYKLWLIVVLITAISFVGYFAIKLAGPRLGTALTSLFGGIASSTALTVGLARLGKQSAELHTVLASGVAIGAATMFLRLLLIVWLLHPPIGVLLAAPLGAMAVTAYAGAALLWHRGRESDVAGNQVTLGNPFELGTAVKFALFLALVVFLSHRVQEWLGQPGLYALAGLSGLADVDAISVSMARNASQGHIALAVAAQAVVLAALVNTAVKAGMVAFLCGGAMARQVTLAMAATLAVGLLVLATV